MVQRVKAGDVIIKHVPDAENPADMLTKWVSKAKVKMSIEYMTDARAIGATGTAANGEAKSRKGAKDG